MVDRTNTLITSLKETAKRLRAAQLVLEVEQRVEDRIGGIACGQKLVLYAIEQASVCCGVIVLLLFLGFLTRVHGMGVSYAT